MGESRGESAELACLTAIRTGRARFFAELVAHAERHAPAEMREKDGALMRSYTALVRSDGAAQIAEFLFLLQELGLDDGARIRPYLERHNAAMDAYLDDPTRMRTLGLTPQRIKGARFTEAQMNFVEVVSPPGRLHLDQSAIGRLLAEVMAPESCRKIVIALAEGGLLRRHTVGQALISSPGHLENLFRAYLGGVVRRIGGAA